MYFDNSDISFSRQDINRNIKLPKSLSVELAELTGIIIGDGCIYKSQSKYEIYVYGHATEDLDYHKRIVSELFYNIFNIKPYLRNIYGTKGIKLCISSKAITNFFIKKVGIKNGNKVKNNIKIPAYFF